MVAAISSAQAMIPAGEAGMPGRVPVSTPPPISAPSITSSTTTAKLASSIRWSEGVCSATIAFLTHLSAKPSAASNIALASRWAARSHVASRPACRHNSSAPPATAIKLRISAKLTPCHSARSNSGAGAPVTAAVTAPTSGAASVIGTRPSSTASAVRSAEGAHMPMPGSCARAKACASRGCPKNRCTASRSE